MSESRDDRRRTAIKDGGAFAPGAEPGWYIRGRESRLKTLAARQVRDQKRRDGETANDE